MKYKLARKQSKRQGAVLIPVVITMFVLTVAALSYISHANTVLIIAHNQQQEITTAPLCESAEQVLLENLWLPFKTNQNFTTLDADCTGSSVAAPTQTTAGSIPGVGCYSCGVINYWPDPANPNYGRFMTLRCVGWIDKNGNGTLDAGEPFKTIDVTLEFSLERSPIFDYTYFTNNYGWMDGFSPSMLYINGDCRANGDFKISNGSPSFDGSITAAQSNNLIPPAKGLVTGGPYKQDNGTYSSLFGSSQRVRQAYNASTMGAYGSPSWEQWKDLIYDQTGQINNNQLSGAAISDANGTRTWAADSYASDNTGYIDTTPTSQVPMPDLNNISTYETLSNSYVDTNATYSDGTANPNYNKGAFVQVWVPSGGSGSYQTVSTNGVVTGSVALMGSATHPVLIHGPVSVTQDVVIAGTVSGQGTLYTGRNTHIVGSLTYANPPNFTGSDLTSINNANQKSDVLGIAAEGSVIVGDTSQYGSNPLQYMEPPFTQARIDDNGNTIPAFNATDVDSTGNELYQSTLGNAYIHSVASSVDEIDAVMYSNHVIGGQFGTDGTKFKLDGSMICKDDATVMYCPQTQMNYDSRVREQSINSKPLIDLNLPRSPSIMFSAWQDRGFTAGVTGN